MIKQHSTLQPEALCRQYCRAGKALPFLPCISTKADYEPVGRIRPILLGRASL